MRRIIVFLLLFIGLSAYAQQSLALRIDSIANLKDTEHKIQLFEAVLKDTTVAKTSAIKGMLFHELSRCYYTLKDYEEAFSYSTKAIEVKSKLSDVTSLNKSRYKLASIYRKQKKEVERYKVFLTIIQDGGADKYTLNSYRSLAQIERTNGDLYKALEYLNNGLANTELCKNTEFESQLSSAVIINYAQIYSNTIVVEESRSDLEIVKKHYKTIIVNSEKFRLKGKSLAILHNSLAIIYDAFGDLQEALTYYTLAKDYFTKSEDLLNELDVITNIGIIQAKLKNYKAADKSFEEVIHKSSDKEQIATAYDDLGYYKNTSITKEKLPYFEKAISVILERENKLSAFQLPTLAEIKKSDYEQDVLIYLIDLADHYMQAFKQENDKSYLIKAKKTVTLIDQLVSLIRYEADTEASKLFWIEKGVNTYMLAVEICYLLDDTANAFYFMEKNKALVLQENIKTLQTKLAYNISAESLEREYKLHYDVLTLQEEFQQHVENDEWKETYSAKNKEYQMFMDSMKHVHPEYIKTKQKVGITSLHSVIAEFEAKETAFVEYILHETGGYGIYYDTEKPIFFKISNISTFHEQLKTLQTFMTKRTMNSAELTAYQEVGYAVFEQLFPFENASERLKNKKLTIIADETLQYIPFELLPTQQSGELSEVYLVNNVETSYLQSFSLFEQIKQKQNSPTQKLLAIAPYEFKNSALPTLTGTEKVLEFLSKYDSSVLLTKKEASKENFLKYRNDFEIIHLNTHAGLDAKTQTPWIAFYDEKMSLSELFGLENQADLVILDACKTNDGVHLSGEGLINLSRGFFYNGTQSVLASQWNVNEQAGNEILQEFYTEIEKGTSKSKALQLAKKAYLQNHDRAQSIPYYWAAFTLTGSTNSVTLQPVQNYAYIVVGITIVVFLLLFFYYRKKTLA
ncbi:CHAT domain-containing protein [Kordia antarctica]|uniref:CHAT domain-containing protein n=1 Tax=Kordia antarctica TaxID=1218801 RepID=UPI00135CE526|nr:CHAT domain-containing tetratricopeptide repeat protein [Kordia antarctica]